MEDTNVAEFIGSLDSRGAQHAVERAYRLLQRLPGEPTIAFGVAFIDLVATHEIIFQDGTFLEDPCGEGPSLSDWCEFASIAFASLKLNSEDWRAAYWAMSKEALQGEVSDLAKRVLSIPEIRSVL